jgi:hypothetical protein
MPFEGSASRVRHTVTTGVISRLPANVAGQSHIEPHPGGYQPVAHLPTTWLLLTRCDTRGLSGTLGRQRIVAALHCANYGRNPAYGVTRRISLLYLLLL